jgi:hypothetical protein
VKITAIDSHLLLTELAKLKSNLTDAELDTKIAEVKAAVRITQAICLPQ